MKSQRRAPSHIDAYDRRRHHGAHASDTPRISRGVFGEWRLQRAIKRLRRGDGRPLEQFRWWQGLFGRVLFYLELSGSDGRRHIHAVEVWRFKTILYTIVTPVVLVSFLSWWRPPVWVYWLLLAPWAILMLKVGVRAHLYLDGRHHAASKTPAVFPVEGGVIEVAVSDTVVRRCHFVADDGTERRLTPDPKSAGGRRVRFDREHPALARLIEFASVLVLVIGLGLQALQALEPISQIPLLADNFGTFESPIRLSLWLNLAFVLVAGLAARERALRLRHNPLLD